MWNEQIRAISERMKQEERFSPGLFRQITMDIERVRAFLNADVEPDFERVCLDACREIGEAYPSDLVWYTQISINNHAALDFRFSFAGERVDLVHSVAGFFRGYLSAKGMAVDITCYVYDEGQASNGRRLADGDASILVQWQRDASS